MPVPARRGRPAKAAAPAQVRRTKAAVPAARKAAPAKVAAPVDSDVASFATRVPTDYHKQFARWIVSEVGYDPESASSKKAAFLRGVSIATVSRSAFMKSDFLEQWREEQGIAKRGPKPKEATAAVRKSPKAAPVEDVDDFDDEDLEDEDLDDDFEDDDFDDEDDADDDFDDEEEDTEPEEEIEVPAPRARRGRPVAKKAAAPAKRAPAKAATRTKRAAPAADVDDEFIF